MTKQGIFVGDSEGFSIHYISGRRQFVAYDREEKEVASANTEKELIETIRAYVKRQMKWTPVEVICPSKNQVVKITSRDMKNPNDEVWISYKDEDGKPTREKIGVGTKRFWRSEELFEVTEENLGILKEIQDKLKLINLAEEDIKTLKQQFTKPYELPEIPTS